MEGKTEEESDRGTDVTKLIFDFFFFFFNFAEEPKMCEPDLHFALQHPRSVLDLKLLPCSECSILSYG